MSTSLKFSPDLPMAIAHSSEIKATRSAMTIVQDHLDNLERQALFFELRDFVSKQFPEVKSFGFVIGQHYDDEGYSDHVVLKVEVALPDGSVGIYEADEESGSFYDDEASQYERLTSFIDELPNELCGILEGENFDMSNERAMAISVMGEQGFANYEAAVIEAVAKSGKDTTAVKVRL